MICMPLSVRLRQVAHGERPSLRGSASIVSDGHVHWWVHDPPWLTCGTGGRASCDLLRERGLLRTDDLLVTYFCQSTSALLCGWLPACRTQSEAVPRCPLTGVLVWMRDDSTLDYAGAGSEQAVAQICKAERIRGLPAGLPEFERRDSAPLSSAVHMGHISAREVSAFKHSTPAAGTPLGGAPPLSQGRCGRR